MIHTGLNPRALKSISPPARAEDKLTERTLRPRRRELALLKHGVQPRVTEPTPRRSKIMAAYLPEETPLTEHEKAAYRYLLYQAMLDIRILCQPQLSLSIRKWRRQYRNSRIAGRIASWQHNLAHHSAYGFDGFNTQEYWRRYDKLCSQFDEFSPGNWMDYRRRYRDHLARLKKE